MEEEATRCALCLSTDARVDMSVPRLRAIVNDIFSFWVHRVDAAAFACFDCVRTIEDFHAFYERVRQNQLLIHGDDKSSTIEHFKNVKNEIEWGDVVIKKEDDENSGDCNFPKPKNDKKIIASKKKIKNFALDDSFEFPTELIRDGKFIVESRVLEEMASRFYDVQCMECKDRFDKLSQMLGHFVTTHGGRPFVECCDMKIYRKEFMYQHMAKHLQPSAFRCTVCSKEFGRIEILKRHSGIHVPEEQRIHRCDKCNKSFGCKSSLMGHMDTHISNEEKKSYKCDKCPKISYTSHAHFSHMRSAHSVPKFLCPVCGKSFRLKGNLSVHLEIHSDERMQCPVCAAMFKTNNTLRQHMKRHGDVKVNCRQCDFSTYNASHLKHHAAMKHSDERPYACEMCGKRFKAKQGLRAHAAQHTGERKYCCPYCPKTFAQSGNFFTHRKRMHDREHKNSLLGK